MVIVCEENDRHRQLIHPNSKTSPLSSTGPTGSGLCPMGFFCPVGTAVPIPSPKGFFSDLEGMVSASVCLPGFYSPTIEVGDLHCTSHTVVVVVGSILYVYVVLSQAVHHDHQPALIVPQTIKSVRGVLPLPAGNDLRRGRDIGCRHMSARCGRADQTLLTRFRDVLGTFRDRPQD